jgi:hypothetical protein
MVAFGDVLASELPLRWVMVTDEYRLAFQGEALQSNALMMISKRVERDEAVSVSELLRTTREQLARREKQEGADLCWAKITQNLGSEVHVV